MATTSKSNYIKVGRVRRLGSGIQTNQDGVPAFLGHATITTDSFISIDRLPFWYPIIPVIMNSVDATSGRRYFGYFDFDMDVDGVLGGTEDMFTDDGTVCCDRKGVKDALKNRMLRSHDYGELCMVCPAMARVYNVTRAVVEALSVRPGVEQVTAFFTGCKGTRILFYDESLWRHVELRDPDNGDAGRRLLESYIGSDLTTLIDSGGVDFDASVYGRGKGLKPDLLCHPYSGVGPALLFSTERGFVQLDKALITTTCVDPVLCDLIRSYWRKVIDAVVPSPSSLIANERRHMIARRVDGVAKRVCIASNFDGIQLGTMTKIHDLMKSALGEKQYIIDSCVLQPNGSYTVRLGCDYRFCHVADDDHSSKAVYFVLNRKLDKVTQKCFAASCAGKAHVLYPDTNNDDFVKNCLDSGKNHAGMARLYVSLVKDSLVLVDTVAGIGYQWNADNCLWVKMDKAANEFNVGHMLIPLAKGLAYEALTQTGVQALVFKQARTLLIDAKFEATLNNIPEQAHLLPISNNLVVDLRDGHTYPRTRDHRFSFECPIVYNECDLHLPTPHADRFFDEIMCNDKDLVRYLAKSLGYCLTAEMSARCVTLWYGIGLNGKGSLSKLLIKLMGPFYVQTRKEVAIKSASAAKGSATPHIVPLVAARICMISETEVTDKLDSGFIKTVSGNDPISCRPLYGPEFTFAPSFKIVLQTNYLPQFDGCDVAVTDRLHIIPFGARFTQSGEGTNGIKMDPAFIDDLLNKHLDEVFRFILRGAIEWYETRTLVMPQSARSLLDEYISDMDLVKQFIETCCVVGGSSSTPRSEVFKRFQDWCILTAETAGSPNAFYVSVKKKGFVQVKVHGVYKYKGITFVN